jgi:hypothetical protein
LYLTILNEFNHETPLEGLLKFEGLLKYLTYALHFSAAPNKIKLNFFDRGYAILLKRANPGA